MQYIFCMEAMFSDYEVEPELDPIIAFKAAYDPDTIYKNQEMQQNDAAKLHKFMQKYWYGQMVNGNFTVEL